MHDPEQKKLEQQKAKKQAMDRVRVPPLGGAGSPDGISVPLSALAVPQSTFRYYLENFRVVADAHGLELRKGGWVLVDREKLEATREPEKSWVKAFLNEKARAGLFQDETKGG